MRNGVYRVQYDATTRKGTAVVTLRDGVLCGCGRTHFILGDCKADGSRLSGAAALRRHSGQTDVQVVEPELFHVSFSGVGGDCFAQFDAVVRDAPAIKAKGTFTWLCEV